MPSVSFLFVYGMLDREYLKECGKNLKNINLLHFWQLEDRECKNRINFKDFHKTTPSGRGKR